MIWRFKATGLLGMTFDTRIQTGEALGQMYVKIAFPAESKARMGELAKHLGASLKGRIEGVVWMSPENNDVRDNRKPAGLTGGHTQY